MSASPRPNAALRIALFGATSAIAHAAARKWAAGGARMLLIGRDAQRLDAAAADLRVRGAAEVAVRVADLDRLDEHAALASAARAAFGGLDIALLAYGSLAEQATLDQDVDAAMRSFHTNATSTISLLLHLATGFEAAGSGTLCAIGSVAGERGRASNYVYGAAKSAVSTCLQGLRQRLAPRGVRVATIKPGFVDTPMTARFRKGLLWASPETVGAGIVAAIARGRSVVYLPGFWRIVMAVLRALPEAVFLRLRI